MEPGCFAARPNCGSPNHRGDARIFKPRWLTRFARRESLADGSLRDAIDRAERGLVDADLGGGLIKQRVARQGRGRSGGYRMLVACQAGDRAILLFGFAKGDLDNVDDSLTAGLITEISDGEG